MQNNCCTKKFYSPKIRVEKKKIKRKVCFKKNLKKKTLKKKKNFENLNERIIFKRIKNLTN
jgi:hypothetical protein